jgi:hypothetical protein
VAQFAVDRRAGESPDVVLKRLAIAPIVTTIAFTLLYALSALLYPGGTRGDPTRVGFSFRDNYWCDVLDRTAYDGKPNPAAPIALAATILLALGLAALWWNAAVLYPQAPRRAAVVRGAGLLSCVAAPFMATTHHDLAINIASALGALAFVITMSAVRAREGWHLVVLGLLALGISGANYAMWQTRWALSAMALVQKAAFVAFLAWVLAFAFRVRARLTDATARAGER